jgi:protein-tyrosine phosphatase
MTELFSGWLATAESEAELELRRRVARAPVETMHSLLGWLDETEGGAEGYLRSAGVSDRQLAAIRARLIGT